MSSEKRRFRPMSVTDILDETVDLYKSNFVLLVGVAAILYVPLTLYIGMFGSGSAQAVSGWANVLQLVAEAIVTGALAFGISERYLGRSASITSSYARILKVPVFFRLFVAMLVKYIIAFGPAVVALILMLPALAMTPSLDPSQQLTVIGGFVVLMLGAFVWMVFFGIRLLLVEPALVVESTGVFHSIGRSWRLTRGSFWRAFSACLTVVVVFLIVFLILYLPVGMPLETKREAGEIITNADKIIPAVVQTVLTVLGIPVFAAVRILLYYDARIRKEAFDLELLANELDRRNRMVVPGDITALPQEQSPQPAPEGDVH